MFSTVSLPTGRTVCTNSCPGIGSGPPSSLNPQTPPEPSASHHRPPAVTRARDTHAALVGCLRAKRHRSAARSHQNLEGDGMAQEGGGTGGQAVGTGLEDGDEIADLSTRQRDLVSQEV